MAALRYWVSACRRRKFARASPGGVRDACQEFRPSYQVHSSMRPVGALRSCWQNSPWGSPRRHRQSRSPSTPRRTAPRSRPHPCDPLRRNGTRRDPHGCVAHPRWDARWVRAHRIAALTDAEFLENAPDPITHAVRSQPQVDRDLLVWLRAKTTEHRLLLDGETGRGGDPVCAAYRSGSSAVAVTRRFRCLPSSVALSAIGCDSPWAFTLSRSGATPAPTRWSRTASTRRSERRWL